VKDDEKKALEKVRNIGISAHIDSGKTTLTERILFYTGRIDSVHEVRGKDGVGAKMDSMELEREKGITIQSAATYATWKDKEINIIDTPGHVDFTIEVERALRVLDGAVLVLCSVGGVQSQTITVDRQMRRYNVPRLCFINKCDRVGAEPFKVIQQLREKLRLNAAAIHVPLGLEDRHEGVLDIVRNKAWNFAGANGEVPTEVDVASLPAHVLKEAEERRRALVEAVAEADEAIMDKYLMEEEIGEAELVAAIRRATVARTFCPVLMGSAYKNKGVQLLLDAVRDFLPSPLEVSNVALDANDDEKEVTLSGSPSAPLVAYAFKLEEGRFGQLTYIRVYSGTVKKGDMLLNTSSGKKVRVSRLVRMHSNELQDVESATSGDIVALFGIDCASGDTFTDGTVKLSMTSLHVPEPVMKLAVAPQRKDNVQNFSRALSRFQREDPTFRVENDDETGQTVIAGMGELHLDIYVERMKREYNVEVETGKPRVNYRETIGSRGKFDYTHKKQTGGQGQYGRVAGYIVPVEEGGENFEFFNEMVGSAIPPNFVPAIEKGFQEACQAGALIGHPVERVRVVLQDGTAHLVDSSELAFKVAAAGAFKQAFPEASPGVLEPVMCTEVQVPTEFQGSVVADMARRRGAVVNSTQDADNATLEIHVPLSEMFGYSTSLRSMTQGKGEFSMEYLRHDVAPRDVQEQLVAEENGKQAAKKASA